MMNILQWPFWKDKWHCTDARPCISKWHIAILLLFLPILGFAQKIDSPTGKLIITFTDIRSDIGNIALGLYDADDQWTDNPRYAYKWDKQMLQNGKITVELDSLPRATYSCAVLDDEDKSLSMNFFKDLTIFFNHCTYFISFIIYIVSCK